MISILVPVFNVDIRTVVKELHRQAELIKIPFEIICLDDHSNTRFQNDSISSLSNCRYEVLPKNVGRGEIRRQLARKAKYGHLLFLDCDVRINQADFLENYIKNIDCPVVIGGIEYDENPPKDKSKYLRWIYGKEREQKSADERSKMKFSHFVASNLLIEKQLFLSIAQGNEISGYGHEDTLLGIKILEKGIIIKHIDNPVEHLGLDSAEVFLEKSLSGVNNLVRLYKSHQVGRQLRIIDLFVRLEKYWLKKITKALLKIMLPVLESNLKSINPRLSYFDMWKLYHFLLFCK